MAHFAQIDGNNRVLNVLVVSNDDCKDKNGNESEQVGIDFLKALIPDPSFRWVQTSFNGNFRKNYAGIGYTYDAVRDAFIPPKPYDSWTLNEDTCSWDAPVPIPGYDKLYSWDEATQSWVEMTR